MKRIALTFLALAVASVARAEFLTGNDLLAKLADKADNMNYALGLGYVGGVHDAGKTVVHCSPAAVTMGQIGDMTRMRLEHDPETAQPERRHAHPQHAQDGVALCEEGEPDDAVTPGFRLLRAGCFVSSCSSSPPAPIRRPAYFFSIAERPP